MTDPATSTSFFEILLQMGGSVTLMAFLAAGLMLAGMSGLRRLRKRATPLPAASNVSSEVLLDTLERTRFDRRSVLGKEEMRLLRCLDAWERRQKKGYSVLAGLPLGSAVRPKGVQTDLSTAPGLGALDRVRLDFLVIDKSGAPVLGVDLPGRSAGSDDEARNAALRQLVFDKARLPLLAPEAGTNAAEVIAKIDHLLGTGVMAASQPEARPDTPAATRRAAQVA